MPINWCHNLDDVNTSTRAQRRHWLVRKVETSPFLGAEFLTIQTSGTWDGGSVRWLVTRLTVSVKYKGVEDLDPLLVD